MSDSENQGLSNEQVAPASRAKRTKREAVPRSELPPDHWNVEHVAAYCGRSKDWVYTHVASGALPHTKRGGCLYFDPDTVAKWLVGKPVAVPVKGRGH
ncbi:helix-turn-helix domain-containing protein [Myxococcus sp. NMCA1]|uniref:helix-turn-helix domain-containing protein n=1 Tax=Myxococcus sp. NMCA1 TaxID=2996785 RepID=UPI002285EA28|nr:helix-turn-helix domain-containing protein [Myxococcus sp. NMCA1]WAM23764.1 helix-turn-helix domain-containing protein [Myxococcus sp. NMCA1]